MLAAQHISWTGQRSSSDEAGLNRAPGGQPQKVTCSDIDAASKTPTPALLTLGRRWYDPTLGRWLSQDPALADTLATQRPAPIALADTVNLYLYVGANPLNLADPTGLGPLDWVGRKIRDLLAGWALAKGEGHDWSTGQPKGTKTEQVERKSPKGGKKEGTEEPEEEPAEPPKAQRVNWLEADAARKAQAKLDEQIRVWSSWGPASRKRLARRGSSSAEESRRGKSPSGSPQPLQRPKRARQPLFEARWQPWFAEMSRAGAGEKRHSDGKLRRGRRRASGPCASDQRSFGAAARAINRYPLAATTKPKLSPHLPNTTSA
jgi:RHS repeat-associated protein